MIDILVLELGREFGSKVIHFHDDPANAGDEKIVTEHRRDGDAERGNRGDKGAGHAGRHRYKVRRAGFGHTGERVHDTPDRAEQSEKG